LRSLPPPTSPNLPNLQNLPPGYSYRKASTGSSLAALAAGAIPKTSPTVIDTIVAIAALHTGTVVLKSSRRLRSSPVPIPRMIPRTPPIKVSVAASTRNCHKTSRRVAPIALRKPISRVRLVTDTIMIAITPIPPTRSAMLESTSITKKHRALLRDDALDDELRAADPDSAADGELRSAEQLVRYVEAQHRDQPPLPLVHVGERRPGREGVVLHHHERRGDTEDEDVAHGTVPPLHVRHRSRPPGLERDRLRVGYGTLDVGDVLGRDDGPALDLLPFFVVDEPDLDGVPTDLKSVDPDDRARDALAYVGVHALNHGHHRDEESDRHDDSEQREERTELVAPRGLEGLENGFGEGHGITK